MKTMSKAVTVAVRFAAVMAAVIEKLLLLPADYKDAVTKQDDQEELKWQNFRKERSIH